MTMKRLALALLLLSNFVHAQKTKPMHNDSYQKRWKKVDSLENKSLPQSAQKEVEAIFEMAKKEKNADQCVKAFVHILKFSSWREEESLVKNLLFAEKETSIAPQPAKALMHSMLAEIYWNYYQTYRHRFQNRTQTAEIIDDDIRTWDLYKIVDKVKSHHLAALEDKDFLLGLKTEVFKESISKGYNSDLLRPTLYEFIAHRAIDFFSANEPNLTQTADFFDITDLKYLGNTQEFAETYLESSDSLSFKFLALKLLQNLLYVRPKDANPMALVDLEIKRLRWVKGFSNSERHNEKYLQSLLWLEREYAQHEASAMASYFVALHHHEQAQLYNPFSNPSPQWKNKEALELCEKIIARFPKSDGALNAASLKASIFQKSIHAESEVVNMPSLPWKVFCVYKNLDLVYLRIYPTSNSDFDAIEKLVERYSKKQEYKSYNEVLVEYFAKKKPQQSWSSKLPTVGDHQTHSVELPMPALGVGNYVILLSDDTSFTVEKHAVAFAETQISDLMVVDRSLKDQTKEIYVLSRTTGIGIPKARIDLKAEYYDYQKYQQVRKDYGTFYTDEQGKFTYKSRENSETLIFDISHNDDKLSKDHRGYRNKSLYVQKNQEIVNDAYKSINHKIFTDRAIYRPGQLVYFKCLIYESDGKEAKVIPSRKQTFTLHDVNGKEIARTEQITNEFGTCNGFFTLPNTGLTGIFSIRADYYSQVGFRVEEYKRPKFELGFEPLKGSFKLGEEVFVSGNAKAFSGAVIDGASVKYRVVRKARFPRWWFWRVGSFPSSPEVEVKNGVVTTDEKGQFIINFIALNDPTVPKESSPIFTYTVYADVTDQNGETRSGSVAVAVGHVAMEIEINAPEMITPSQSEPFSINTKNLNGQVEPGKVNLKVYKLKNPEKAYRNRFWETPDFHVLEKAEHDKLFPFDEFSRENDKSTWPKQKLVFETVIDTKTDNNWLPKDLKKWTTGTYLIEATSKDIYGSDVFTSLDFVLEDPNEKKPATLSPIQLKV
ncbi:MAG: MG2 domain-containing protein, partial [Cytophagales bacterium]